MPWLESHTKTRRHHKLLRLAEKLKIKPPQLVGHLHLLWWNVIELREDGDITIWSPQEVAQYAEWEGDPNSFYQGLIDEDWLTTQNGYTLIHDWLDYAWRYLQGKYRTSHPEKLIEIKAKHDRQKGCSSKMPKLPENTPVTFDFEAIWSKYPSKVGKKEAERHFNASVKTKEDYDNIQKALNNYLASKRVKDGYILNASTWFNNWKDWVTYKDIPKVIVKKSGEFTPPYHKSFKKLD